MRDFTSEVSRWNTNSIKWDLIKKENKPEGTIPMWVADMDFKVPDEVEEAVTNVAKHGIYGYSFCPDTYYKAVAGWFKKHHNFHFTEEDVVTTPGVVTAVAAAVRAYTNEGDGVLIQRPVYYPFTNMIVNNGRKVVNNPLMNVEGRYIMDLKDMEQKIVDNKVKLMILCSPHNPISRVWNEEELKEVAAICKKYNVTVVSDEIHADFTYGDNKHTTFTNVMEEAKDFVVTCTAPSKTFNLAGLQTSNIIIFNKELREKFQAELDKMSVGMIGPMGIAACEAAYTYGEKWLSNLKDTIYDNFQYMKEFIEDHAPELVVTELEGTYLAWVDMTGLAMTNDELKKFILEDCRIWVDDGDMFGAEGENFARFNLATPRCNVEKAMKQLEEAILKRYK